MTTQSASSICWTASKEAINLSAEKTQAEIEKERLLNLGLVRLIEIVGEAAGRVSAEGLSKYRGIPWIQIIGMRNRLIHGYDNIDFGILYKTITEDLPPLVAELENILRTDQKDR